MSEVRAAAATPAGSGDPSDVDPQDDGDDAGPTSVARTRWGGAVAVGVPSAVLGLHSASYGQWIVDDAGITFAYARSLATGAGPVLQPGAAAVEGYSDPTWLALLVAAHRLRWWCGPTMRPSPEAARRGPRIAAGIEALLIRPDAGATSTMTLDRPDPGTDTAPNP